MSIITILNEAYKDLVGHLLFLAGIILGIILVFLFKLFKLKKINGEESKNSEFVNNLDRNMRDIEIESNKKANLRLHRAEFDLEDRISDQNVVFIDRERILNHLQSTLFRHLHLNLNSDSRSIDLDKNDKEYLLKISSDELNKMFIEAQIKCELRGFIANYIKDKKNIILEDNRLISGAKDITNEVMDKFILHLDKTDILK